MKKYLLLAAAALVFLSSCHRHYTASSFESKSATHRLIAIMPAEMVFTGIQPKKLKPEDIAAIEEKESLAFQQSLQNGILRQANTGRYQSSIQVQDISTTQKLLNDAGISVRQSWTVDDRELARILGVDAIVRMRIEKKRYMSDLASFGIDMGRDILWQVTKKDPILTPGVTNKTNDIFASCRLVSNGETLWNDTYDRSADYSRPAENVIEDITNKFGKHFPYRKKK